MKEQLAYLVQVELEINVSLSVRPGPAVNRTVSFLDHVHGERNFAKRRFRPIG